jgi:4-diphosphocytidyl-2-C-methyl-D-erythritol kinase
MRLLSPAKINLHLRVGPPRSDGFHPLLSWMCTVGLFDELTLEPGSREKTVELECNDPAIPNGPANLIVRAALALGADARIKLTKRIPVGGGLAGGSSNAATTLMGLNRLLNLNRTTADLAKIAATLGSDIAFFLHGPSSICTSLGEIVHPIRPPRPRWALLIFPPFGMPTPQVYRRFDELHLGTTQSIDQHPDWPAWANMLALELLPNLVNDLEAPAFDLQPKLAAMRDEWEQRLGRSVRMSGSGSTLFTLYDTKPEADAALDDSNMCTMHVAELAAGGREENQPEMKNQMRTDRIKPDGPR